MARPQRSSGGGHHDLACGELGALMPLLSEPSSFLAPDAGRSAHSQVSPKLLLKLSIPVLDVMLIRTSRGEESHMEGASDAMSWQALDAFLPCPSNPVMTIDQIESPGRNLRQEDGA